MKELIRVRVQYASRQQCCKTHKRPLPFFYVDIPLCYLAVRLVWRGLMIHLSTGVVQRERERERECVCFECDQVQLKLCTPTVGM